MFGNAHPDALQSGRRLADTLFRQGEVSEAVDIYREMFELRMDALGAEHEETLISAVSFARGLVLEGKFEEAVPILRRAFEVRRCVWCVWGVAHPDTLKSARGLADAYF